MKINRLMWILVAVVMSVTAAVVIETPSGYGQESCLAQAQVTPESQLNILNKYPVVDYDAEEIGTAAELEQRSIKNKRYNKSFPIIKNPSPEDFAISGSDDDNKKISTIPFLKVALLQLAKW